MAVLAVLMLHKLEVCFDQESWAVKSRFRADPEELAGEQLLESGGQKPEGMAGAPCACLSPLNGEHVHARGGKEGSAVSLLPAGSTAVPRGPACTLSSFPSFVQAIYLYKPCCSHPQRFC